MRAIEPTESAMPSGPKPRPLEILGRTLMRTLSPADRLSIFIFHRVLPAPDPLLPWEPDSLQFDWIVRLISHSYNVLPLADAALRLARRSLPAAAATITFDDGYADNLQVAVPVLRRYGVTATFFIATGYLDGGRMWNDDVIEAVRTFPSGAVDLGAFGLGVCELEDIESRVRCYERILSRIKYLDPSRREGIARAIAQQAGVADRSDLMMTTDQVRSLAAAGMEVGGHTITHPILQCVDDAVAIREIADGRRHLESILGVSPSVFAYPNGVPGQDYSERHVAMVQRAGYTAAVSTAPSIAKADADPFQLPRFTPWDRRPLPFALRCAGRLLASRTRRAV